VCSVYINCVGLGCVALRWVGSQLQCRTNENNMESLFLFQRHLVVLTLLFCGTGSRDEKTHNASGRHWNILMLIADDMRPEIGAFYDPIRPYSMFSRIKTPSLNSLAAKSLVLRRAYVQQAICAPSRVSFLTSRRPDTTLVYTIEDTYWRNIAGNLTTIPQFFKQNGYRSIGIGKVFHHGSGSDQVYCTCTCGDQVYTVRVRARLCCVKVAHKPVVSVNLLMMCLYILPAVVLEDTL
jgi:Sulfatase